MEDEILKKAAAYFTKAGRTGKVCKKDLAEHDTGTVCEILQVSRSTYYREPKGMKSEKIKLEKVVVHCFKSNDGKYGRIRRKKSLKRKGITIS